MDSCRGSPITITRRPPAESGGAVINRRASDPPVEELRTVNRMRDDAMNRT
jgi:hypothetical protein